MNNPQLSRKEEIEKGCGKELCKTPDILTCGKDTDLWGEIIYCDECAKKFKKQKTDDKLLYLAELKEKIDKQKSEVKNER